MSTICTTWFRRIAGIPTNRSEMYCAYSDVSVKLRGVRWPADPPGTIRPSPPTMPLARCEMAPPASSVDVGDVSLDCVLDPPPWPGAACDGGRTGGSAAGPGPGGGASEDRWLTPPRGDGSRPPPRVTAAGSFTSRGDGGSGVSRVLMLFRLRPLPFCDSCRTKPETSESFALLTHAKILAHARSRSAGSSLHSFTSAMDTKLRTARLSAASSRTFLTETALASCARSSFIISVNSSKSRAPLWSASKRVNLARTSSSLTSVKGKSANAAMISSRSSSPELSSSNFVNES